MCVYEYAYLCVCIRRQGHGSEVTLPIEGGGEGHVVKSSRDGVRAGVRRHAGDAVLGLVRRELTPQLIHQDIVLHEERVIHLVINLDTLTLGNYFLDVVYVPCLQQGL